MNFLRLLLATAVIVSHSLPITGSDDPTGHGIHELGTWAVHGFFIASGYLIAMSRMRTGLAPFMWRRFIRIFPAFWVSLALVAFVIAPVTALLAGEQIVWRSALGYVFRNAGLWVFQSEVADTLTDLPLPHVWQGTLWTLAFEFVAYLSAGALLSLRLVRRYPVQIIGALLACSVALMVVVAEPQPMAVNPAVNGVRLAGYFLAGMLFYFLRDKVRFSWAWMVVGFAMIAAAWQFIGWNNAYMWVHLPLAYLVLAIGSALPVKIGSSNDISYGIYIYGWPAQQVAVVIMGAGAGWITNTAIAVVVAAILAAASWFAIERPALKLKDLVGSRQAAEKLDAVPATQRSA